MFFLKQSSLLKWKIASIFNLFIFYFLKKSRKPDLIISLNNFSMKQLILIRHVKSDWTGLVPDFDRPVREDRTDDALHIAKEIAKNDQVPQHIVSSPALRTMQTARLLCTVWKYPAKNIETDSRLYECAASDIMKKARTLNDEYQTITIVCHNPAITDFVNRYSDSSIDNVPTTGAVMISFDTENWKGIEKGKLNWFLRPKGLRD